MTRRTQLPKSPQKSFFIEYYADLLLVYLTPHWIREEDDHGHSWLALEYCTWNLELYNEDQNQVIVQWCEDHAGEIEREYKQPEDYDPF